MTRIGLSGNPPEAAGFAVLELEAEAGLSGDLFEPNGGRGGGGFEGGEEEEEAEHATSHAT